jgi:hypothetical protein
VASIICIRSFWNLRREIEQDQHLGVGAGFAGDLRGSMDGGIRRGSDVVKALSTSEALPKPELWAARASAHEEH